MKKNKRFRYKGTMNAIDAIFVMLAISVAAVLFINQTIPVLNKGKAEGIVRKYIIKGQQQGVLSGADITKLTRELQDKGCKNILIKTNNDKAKYGDNIDLIVEYDIDVKEMKIDENSVFPTFEVQTKKITIDKSTISTST